MLRLPLLICYPSRKSGQRVSNRCDDGPELASSSSSSSPFEGTDWSTFQTSFEFSAPTDPTSALSSTGATLASPETEATQEHPRRVISPLNFEKALKEIAPPLLELLGRLSGELRKWNDEFGEGKREKWRNMWGKGSFGFVEKGEGWGELKIAANAGSGGGSEPSSV